MGVERRVNYEINVPTEIQVAANQFVQRRRDEGINCIIFDLDDTICYTHPVFAFYRDFYIKLISASAGLDYENLAKEFEEINRQAFMTHFVRQDRWGETARLLSNNYLDNPKIGETAYELLPLLDNIYKTPPQFMPGTEVGLEALNRTGIILACNTHGPKKYKDFQDEILQLRSRFFGDRFYVAAADRPKEWKDALEDFRIHPAHVMIYGDNLFGDVIAGHNAGAKKVVWFNNPEGWGHYKLGEVPEYADVVGGFEELLKL